MRVMRIPSTSRGLLIMKQIPEIIPASVIMIGADRQTPPRQNKRGTAETKLKASKINTFAIW